MKSVLISIQPKWCELIAAGKKTVEVRKTKPKLEPPFKCYIYCTKDEKYRLDDGKRRFNGKVIGEFVCDRITPATVDHIKDIARAACLSIPEMWEYGKRSSAYDLFGWHISDLVIYDEPKPLTDFVVRHCLWENIRNNGCIDASGERCLDCRLKRPPQSWCYVEVE